MKSISKFLIGKGTYVLGLMIASLAGGILSAVVLAAIPDNNNQINACYSNANKTLKVTDPAGNCSGNETALSWSQQGQVNAYAHVDYDSTNGTYSLDPNRSKNVTMTADPSGHICFTASFTPRSIAVTGDGSSASVAIKDNNGWTNSNIGPSLCDTISPGSNADVAPQNNTNFFVDFF